MATITRKQRELQDREVKILSLARPILLREGYQALSMERLASEMEYAKGTLYNHFPNKEEIILALAIEAMELRFRLFEFGSMISRESRHRLLGIGAAGEVYTGACSEYFAIENWLRNSTIWDKSSPQRRELIRQCESRCLGIVSGIVRDAVVSGDLELPEGLSAEEMIFGFWAINFGSQTLASTSPSLPSLGIPDAPKAIRYHCHRLLNGFDWQPIDPFDRHIAVMDDYVQQIRKHYFESK